MNTHEALQCWTVLNRKKGGIHIIDRLDRIPASEYVVINQLTVTFSQCTQRGKIHAGNIFGTKCKAFRSEKQRTGEELPNLLLTDQVTA